MITGFTREAAELSRAVLIGVWECCQTSIKYVFLLLAVRGPCCCSDPDQPETQMHHMLLFVYALPESKTAAVPTGTPLTPSHVHRLARLLLTWTPLVPDTFPVTALHPIHKASV